MATSEASQRATYDQNPGRDPKGPTRRTAIGQLLAGWVDPMEIGIAHEDKLLLRRANGVEPGLQGRQVGVIEIVHIVAGIV